jgi:hypothetical protein
VQHGVVLEVRVVADDDAVDVAVQGLIFRQLDGNKWAPQKLASAILEAARGRLQVAQP